MARREPTVDKVAAGARLRDSDALARVWERCYPRVYRYMYLRLGDRETAEDLASDVMLRILRSFGRFEGRGLPFDAWVYRIAGNRLRD